MLTSSEHAQDQAAKGAPVAVYSWFSYFTATMMESPTTPIALQERAQILDVLRGFAILGLLLDNMFSFSGYMFLQLDEMQALPTWPADGVLAVLELALVHGKFYCLFSLLFGIGFSIILVRHQQRGANALPFFYRRLIILILIGAAHLYFLWPGDILLLYALIGLVLPLFTRCTDKQLLLWAGCFVLSPIVIDILKVVFQFRLAAPLNAIGESIDASVGIHSGADLTRFLFGETSGWKEFWQAQQSGFFFRYAYLIESNRPVKVLGMFVLGLYAGRKMMHTQLHLHKPLLRKIQKWGFLVGLPANIAMAWFEIDDWHVPAAGGLLDTVSYAVGVVPLSLAYTATVCLVWIKKDAGSRLRWLAAPGRMALSNYIMQTLVSITLLYAVGFGFGGAIGPVVFFPLALIIYLSQVVLSNWWFRYFQYGPLEWIWRQLTYGKRLPLRKPAQVLQKDAPVFQKTQRDVPVE